jgi:hypothetical protein
MFWQDAEIFFADLKFPETAKKSDLTPIGLKYGGHYFFSICHIIKIFLARCQD